MKIRTAELTGQALNYAVAICHGKGIDLEDKTDPWLESDGIADQPLHSYTPSTDWAQGGPIIQRENICTEIIKSKDGDWIAIKTETGAYGRGPTILVSAMRCYVSSRLGDEIEIPDEILK